MLLEFQLSLETFGLIVRNQFHQVNLCVEDTIKDILMVNRILVKNNTTLKRQPGKVVLRQPLQLELVLVQDLKRNEAKPSQPSLPAEITEISILLDITASVMNDDVVLKLAFANIDFQALKEQLTINEMFDIRNKVSSKFQTVRRALGLSAIFSELNGGSLTLTNAGVTAINNGQILVIRVEVNSSADPVASWTDFYNTYERNLLAEQKWAMLIDKGILVPFIKEWVLTLLTEAEKAVVNKDEDKYFSLEGDIGVSWNPGQEPVFDVAFTGTYHNACSCFGDTVDIELDLSITIFLEVVEGKNPLRMTGHITYDIDHNFKSRCCEATGALFWPIAGAILLGKEKISLYEYIGGWGLYPITSFIAASNFAANQSVIEQLGDLKSECNKIDDETLYCDIPFPLDMGSFGGVYKLSGVYPEPEGVVFVGTAGIKELLDPELSITSVKEFSWSSQGDCATGFNAEARASISFKNAVGRSILDSILKVCVASPLIENKISTDRENCFDFKISSVSVSGSVTITLRSWKWDVYFANPYPCIVKLVTNGGVRIITLDPVKQMTAQEEQEVNRQIDLARDLCKRYWTVPIDRWQPEPYPDPRPEWLIIGQIWQLVVAELKGGESVDLIGRDDLVLATGFANRLGVAEVSYWTEGPVLTSEIGLRINTPSGKGKKEDQKWPVSIKQAQLTLLSRVALKDSFKDMLIERPDGHTVLSIQTLTAKTVYDISNPQAPSLQSREMVTTSEERQIPSEFDSDVFALIEQKKIKNVEEITHIERVKMLGAKRAVYLLDRNATGRIVDLSDSKNARDIGQYFHAPWFVNSYRSGKIFAKLSLDGRFVSIYEIEQVIDI